MKHYAKHFSLYGIFGRLEITIDSREKLGILGRYIMH
jgi:hypothetical protein